MGKRRYEHPRYFSEMMDAEEQNEIMTHFGFLMDECRGVDLVAILEAPKGKKKAKLIIIGGAIRECETKHPDWKHVTVKNKVKVENSEIDKGTWGQNVDTSTFKGGTIVALDPGFVMEDCQIHFDKTKISLKMKQYPMGKTFMTIQRSYVYGLPDMTQFIDKGIILSLNGCEITLNGTEHYCGTFRDDKTSLNVSGGRIHGKGTIKGAYFANIGHQVSNDVIFHKCGIRSDHEITGGTYVKSDLISNCVQADRSHGKDIPKLIFSGGVWDGEGHTTSEPAKPGLKYWEECGVMIGVVWMGGKWISGNNSPEGADGVNQSFYAKTEMQALQDRKINPKTTMGLKLADGRILDTNITRSNNKEMDTLWDNIKNRIDLGLMERLPKFRKLIDRDYKDADYVLREIIMKIGIEEVEKLRNA